MQTIQAAANDEVISVGAKFVEVEGAADVSKGVGTQWIRTRSFSKSKRPVSPNISIKADIVITTARLFGKKAPVLVTSEMIDSMKAGSLTIDLIAAIGGNTELTLDNATILSGNVTEIGNSNLAASVPSDASKLYGRNVTHFIKLLINAKGVMEINLKDNLILDSCVSMRGKVFTPVTLKLA